MGLSLACEGPWNRVFKFSVGLRLAAPRVRPDPCFSKGAFCAGTTAAPKAGVGNGMLAPACVPSSGVSRQRRVVSACAGVAKQVGGPKRRGARQQQAVPITSCGARSLLVAWRRVFAQARWGRLGIDVAFLCVLGLCCVGWVGVSCYGPAVAASAAAC